MSSLGREELKGSRGRQMFSQRHWVLCWNLIATVPFTSVTQHVAGQGQPSSSSALLGGRCKLSAYLSVLHDGTIGGRGDPAALARLAEAAEVAKRALSGAEEATVDLVVVEACPACKHLDIAGLPHVMVEVLRQPQWVSLGS